MSDRPDRNEPYEDRKDEKPVIDPLEDMKDADYPPDREMTEYDSKLPKRDPGGNDIMAEVERWKDPKEDSSEEGDSPEKGPKEEPFSVSVRQLDDKGWFTEPTPEERETRQRVNEAIEERILADEAAEREALREEAVRERFGDLGDPNADPLEGTPRLVEPPMVDPALQGREPKDPYLDDESPYSKDIPDDVWEEMQRLQRMEGEDPPDSSS